MRRLPNKLCVSCGKSFWPRWGRQMKFCSMACVWKHNKENPNWGTWKKGCVSPNRGRKGVHFSPATEFKKGQRGITRVGLGTETVRLDKSGIGRRWIKVQEPNVWIEYAKYLWCYIIGDIPVGLLVHHRNEISLDDRIENLDLVTRAEHINAHREQLLMRKAYHKRAKAKYRELFCTPVAESKGSPKIDYEVILCCQK